MNRDGAMQSAWQQEVKEFGTPPTIQEHYDVAIVGAGITGLTTAERLQAAGLNCIVLEAANIGYGTTGGTTAHLNNFFDSSYDEVIKNFGEEEARLLARAGEEAIEAIRFNVQQYQIDCDFAMKTAYLFATDPDQEEQLESLVDGTRKAGIAVEFDNQAVFPIPFKKQARIGGQAQFHPLKYIRALAEAFLQQGGTLVEQARVLEHRKEGEDLILETKKGQIKARHIVYATHTAPGVHLLHFRLIPWRSYVIAARLKKGSIHATHTSPGAIDPRLANNTQVNSMYDALGYDLADPYHYYRFHSINGETLLIAGGKDHKTGKEEDTEQVFRELEAHVRRYFDLEEVVYSWSSQYYEPADGLPYIGHLPGHPDGVYVATGYNGNGMIFGTVSAILIDSLIRNGDHAYKNLFNPARVKPVAGAAKFVEHGANVVSSFIADKLSVDKIASLVELNNDEARIVKYEGDTYAMYKDQGGVLHAISSNCSHINCTIAWNRAEKTWDCPCHGSRFNINGKVLTGPAVRDLDRVKFAVPGQKATNEGKT